MTAPVGWYRTHFHLALPGNASVPLSLRIPQASDQAVIWLNGWLIGRYWEQRGPQHDFYLPQGILVPQGDNVLAIAVWNRGHVGGLTARPQLVADPGLRSHTLSDASSEAPASVDYWHTAGNRIVDSHGRPVRIAAVNWSGMQTRRFVPAGLDIQPLDAIMQRIKSLGFNTVRLPFSNQMVEQNPIVTDGLQANPTLQGLHALDIMDRIVASAREHGLRMILDDHRSDVGTDPELNGLWYTKQYPESAWIRDWQALTKRYLGDSTVVGMDLRDEPHTGPPGPWSLKTYLHQGATWGPYNGVEHRATDWRLAAERGGDAVLAVNPHLLVFVEGLQQYPDPTQPGGLDSYWWGGVLQPAARYPVVLSVPHQLVYSPHEYGPTKYSMPFFGPHMTYASQAAVWEKHWSYLEKPGYAQETPIFIGEFGTCGQPLCVQDTAPGSEGLWFQFFLRYLKLHPEIGWAFWAVNGTNSDGNIQPNYIFRRDWKTVRLHQIIDAFRDIEIPPPPGG
jgi:endoglucanase